jgi:hypothetical protein
MCHCEEGGERILAKTLNPARRPTKQSLFAAIEIASQSALAMTLLGDCGN